METFFNGAMLAGCLAGGIAFGAWLTRTGSISKSLLAQLFVFAAMVAAPIYLAEKPVALACVVGMLASVIAVWVGRKTMPETAERAYPTAAYRDTPAPNEPISSGLMFGKRGQTNTPWSDPSRRFRRPPSLSRVTPTGKTIKMVRSDDTVKPGKRKRDHLRAVK